MPVKREVFIQTQKLEGVLEWKVFIEKMLNKVYFIPFRH